MRALPECMRFDCVVGKHRKPTAQPQHAALRLMPGFSLRSSICPVHFPCKLVGPEPDTGSSTGIHVSLSQRRILRYKGLSFRIIRISMLVGSFQVAGLSSKARKYHNFIFSRQKCFRGLVTRVGNHMGLHSTGGSNPILFGEDLEFTFALRVIGYSESS
jgi:hypothetical protein